MLLLIGIRSKIQFAKLGILFAYIFENIGHYDIFNYITENSGLKPRQEIALLLLLLLNFGIYFLLRYRKAPQLPFFRGNQRRFPPKCNEKPFQAIQSTIRSLEMYSKWHYKICLYSVILQELEDFRNFKGYSVIFPKSLDVIEIFTRVIIFLIPLSITFLNPKILRFLFLRNLS